MNIAFLAFPEQAELLLSELKERYGIKQKPSKVFGELYYYEDFPELSASDAAFPSEPVRPYWARTIMLEPFFQSFNSIGEAATALKQLQRNWAPYQYTCFRRAQLIQEKLPYINLKDRKFPVEIPQSPIGLYTLIDEHTMIASAKTTSCLPAGTLHFVEDHENPPSRAYLKIQESLTMANHFSGVPLPGPENRCFEAGACPGGWTWVLANLGTTVFAVDRAPLADSLMKNPLITFMAHDAFTLTADQIGPVDWIFSDVICYPERLLEWIQKWLTQNPKLKMICTIKMQGAINWPLIREFTQIPSSRVLHLNYNKHELTWIHAEPDEK